MSLWLWLCACCVPFGSADADGGAPVVPAGTKLVEGVAGHLEVSGDLKACELDTGPPTELELTHGLPNGPFESWSLRLDPIPWTGWQPDQAVALTSVPEKWAMGAIITTELGRPLAANGVYGIVGGFRDDGEGCVARLYGTAVEPTADGFQVTEVVRVVRGPKENGMCGLDRAEHAKSAPCGTRILRATGVTPPSVDGPLTERRLLSATGLARGMAVWDDTEALLVRRLGPPLRIDGDTRIWAVRGTGSCVWYTVQKGWPGGSTADGKPDPVVRVGAVLEPYRTEPGGSWYDECMAATAP